MPAVLQIKYDIKSNFILKEKTFLSQLIIELMPLMPFLSLRQLHSTLMNYLREKLD